MSFGSYCIPLAIAVWKSWMAAFGVKWTAGSNHSACVSTFRSLKPVVKGAGLMVHTWVGLALCCAVVLGAAAVRQPGHALSAGQLSGQPGHMAHGLARDLQTVCHTASGPAGQLSGHKP